MCSLVFFFAAHVAEMGEIEYDEPTKATLNYTSLSQLSLTIVICLVLACLAMTCGDVSCLVSRSLFLHLSWVLNTITLSVRRLSLSLLDRRCVSSWPLSFRLSPPSTFSHQLIPALS